MGLNSLSLGRALRAGSLLRGFTLAVSLWGAHSAAAGPSQEAARRAAAAKQTVLEAEERSTKGVLDALRKGRCRGEGRGISLGERLRWPRVRV